MTDIGVPPPHAPMDFAAWIEVYLGGRWHVFDPRNNVPRIGQLLKIHTFFRIDERSKFEAQKRLIFSFVYEMGSAGVSVSIVR